jgi:tetratricopeptide (TPR) repeat protein
MLLSIEGLERLLEEERRKANSFILFIFPIFYIFLCSILFLLSSSVLFAGRIYGMGKGYFVIFSFILTLLDLIPLGMISNNCDSPNSLRVMEDIRKNLKAQNRERIAGVRTNLPVILRISSPEGYDSVYPDWYFKAIYPRATRKEMRWEVSMEPQSVITRLLGVKYLIPNGELHPIHNPLKTEGLEFLKSINGLMVYEVKNALPRVFVPQRFVILNENDSIKYLHQSDFNPDEFLILTDIPDKFPAQGMSGRAEILSYEPHRVLIEAKMETDGFLVLTDTYYPGWKVYVDGNERRIYRAYSFLRAVKLEKGKHEVLFRFSPLTYRIGKIITFIVFILLLLLSPFKIKSLMEIKEKNYQLNSQTKPSFLPFLLFPVLLILIYTFLWYHSFSDFRKSRWHFYNGVLLSQIEGPESGIKEMENALSYKTYKPHTYFFLGKLYNEIGKKKEAAEILEFAKRYFPRDIETNILLIALYRELGMEEKVKAQMKELEKYGRDWSLALERDGFGFLYAQDIKTAIKAFLSAIILNPKRGRAYYGLALAYMMDDNPEEALKAIRTALSLEPDKKAYKSLLEEILKTME